MSTIKITQLSLQLARMDLDSAIKMLTTDYGGMMSVNHFLTHGRQCEKKCQLAAVYHLTRKQQCTGLRGAG